MINVVAGQQFQPILIQKKGSTAGVFFDCHVKIIKTTVLKLHDFWKKSIVIRDVDQALFGNLIMQLFIWNFDYYVFKVWSAVSVEKITKSSK